MRKTQTTLVGPLISILAMMPQPQSSAEQPKARVIVSPGHAVGIASLAFSPARAVLASADSDGAIRLLDARTATEIRRLQRAGFASSIAFSPDGKALAAGGSNAKGEDADLTLIDVATGKETRRFDF